MQNKKVDNSAIQADYERWSVDDPSYNVAKNRAVIEQTIKDYEAMRAKKVTEHNDAYGERADAVVSYLMSLDRRSTKTQGSSTDIEKYFGRRMMAYMRGQAIREKLMGGLMLKNKQGQLVKPNF